MSLADYLTPTRTLILPTSDRDEAIDLLVNAICRDEPRLTREAVFNRIIEREQQLTSRLDPGIALPHAVFDEYQNTMLALGLSREGITWDPTTEERVHLVLLLVGGRQDHLQVLSDIALKLKQQRVVERLMSSGSPDELYAIITAEELRFDVHVAEKNRQISRVSLEQALFITRQMGDARLIIYADAVGSLENIKGVCDDPRALIVTGGQLHPGEKSDEGGNIIHIPFRSTNRSAIIQFTLLFLLSQGLISRDEVIVNLSGLPGSGYFDTIRLSFIEHELRIPEIMKKSDPTGYNQHIFTRVLQIANELAVEGREGKAVGTLFVYGHYDEVKKYSRQMIINPFGGVPEEDRNILDPSLEETLKEYAKIDGAFIISENGTIMSAGTYISGVSESGELHSGLGARHAAALGITAVTSAFSIALSESTRKISLFQGGKRIMEM